MTPEQVVERMVGYGRRGAMFVCRVGRRPVGFAVLGADPDDPNLASMGVWVLPPYRRRGLAHQLALLAIDFARRRGYRRLEGTIPAGNEGALSFFSDMGSLVPLVAGGMKYELPV
jgi:GNAT superfamily N-acetyltransferase